MVDRDKLEGMLRQLREYTTFLQAVSEQGLHEFLQDPRSIGSARYYLQISIESCINIANHIIATERLRAPRDYRDSFTVLNEAGILPGQFTRTMRELAGLRNLLVHIYWDIDDQMIYDGIRSDLNDFENYLGYIVTFLDRGQAWAPEHDTGCGAIAAEGSTSG